MAKELAVKQEVAEFPALQQDPGALREALMENLGGAGLSPFDLDRIKIPSAGNTNWTVPTLDGGETNTPELIGVIIHSQTVRAYWAQAFADSGGGTPPDCSSEDGVTGIGSPGGSCFSCPYAAFGSDERHLGQACKLMKRLFWLKPGDLLPVIINITPGSLSKKHSSGIIKYMLRLTSQGFKASGVVTKATLVKDKSAGKIEYSRAEFALVGHLDKDQAIAARALGQAIAPAFRQVNPSDFTPSPEETY